ncbi:60S ribosomal protein L23 [Tilletiaria anomala UBC 951]|uniref:60S ribosomal protein L23 n=1 Tax=Tilletiaria anomala (strain ATCC 24038 / CBS 436.72 / UBC 951) TaxID=1037660 RepID=A0A066V349_TILAU|nr:60S ribosomal protein L23 [Tilletiaria anomala UBC 951]KDN36142.1 60S ribosomal protein L23 [Tilletiaria anomala UBC 951]
MSQVVGNTALLFTRSWHQVSARSRVLGPLAVSIATTLMGKHKPHYDPSVDAFGDYVVVTNARDVVLTGRKEEQKKYYRHSMYPGGLKVTGVKELRETKPEEIIREAVAGMLPKNTLRDRRLERLKVFPDDAHPYTQNITKRYDLPAKAAAHATQPSGAPSLRTLGRPTS